MDKTHLEQKQEDSLKKTWVTKSSAQEQPGVHQLN